MANFTHFNQDGEAIMVDVSQKDITMRIAIAEGSIKVNQEVFRSIKEQTNKKGDVLAVARIAGIMAAKKTSDMIPLCHPLFITKVTIDFELDEDNYMIKAIATTKVNGKTGVEMEALHAVSVTLLTKKNDTDLLTAFPSYEARCLIQKRNVLRRFIKNSHFYSNQFPKKPTRTYFHRINVKFAITFKFFYFLIKF